MNHKERTEAAATVAGICARGYDLHVEAHGPDGSRALKADGKYQVAGTMIGGAMAFVFRAGEWFAVNVIPMDTPPNFPGAEKTGPVMSYEPKPED